MATVPFSSGYVPTPLPPPASAPNTPTTVPAGAQPETAYGVLRSHLNPALGGTNWDIVLRALATGDSYNSETARNAFDQLFLSSAEGRYLDIRGADFGIRRPQHIGVGDEAYRDIVLNYKTGQVILTGLLDTMESFYGADATRAFVEAGASEPYAIEDGDTLILESEKEERVTLVFRSNDFQTPGAAKAIEVAAAINRQLRWYRQSAYAVAPLDPSTGEYGLKIYSGALGLRGWMRCWGGRAQLALSFPSLRPTTQVAGTTFTVGAASRADWARITWSGGTDPSLYAVKVGDYVACYGAGWAEYNTGSFEVMAATNTYIEIANDVYAAQAYAITGAADVRFFYPQKFDIQSREHFAVVAQTSIKQLDILLPATSPIIARTRDSAAYLLGGTSVGVESVVRTEGDATATITTSVAHGFTTGDKVWLDDILAAAPATQTYGSVAGANAPATVAHHTATKLLDGRVLVCGGTGGVDSTDAWLYDPESDTWGVAASMNVSRWQHCAVLLPNGRVLVIGGDNSVDGTLASCEVYDPDSDVWAPTSDMNEVRGQFGAVLLDDGRVWACGGLSATNTEAYDYLSGTWTVTAAIPAVRWSFTPILLPGGNVLIAGGRDALSVSENQSWVYNPSIDTFTQSATMPMNTSDYGIAYVPEGASGKVIISGGKSPLGANQANTIRYDIPTDSWSVDSSMSEGKSGHRLVALPNDRLLSVGATTPYEEYDYRRDSWSLGSGAGADGWTFMTATALDDGRILIVGGYDSVLGGAVDSVFLYGVKKVIQTGGFNGLFEVTVTSATEFEIETDHTYATNLTGLTGTATAAVAGSGFGPHVYDPVSGLAITSNDTTVTQDLNYGEAYSTISVADASGFPDSPGWVVFDFGGAGQVGPVPYFNRPTTGLLVLDRSYVFPRTVSAGASVTLLTQKGGWVPDDPRLTGSLVLTASTAGRVMAEQQFGKVVAAGVIENQEILYPGDYGLGGAGNPVQGQDKLSDSVSVWAGDDVDDEVALRRRST